MADKWYAISKDLLEAKLKTNFTSGLDNGEAADRLKRAGENRLYQDRKNGIVSGIKSYFFGLTDILLIICLVLSKLFNSDATAITSVVLIVLNVIAAFVLFVYNKKMCELHQESTHPLARAVRHGKLYMLRQEQLVVGDIVYIGTGDIVPADLRLLESENLSIDDTGFTSHTHAVAKNAAFVEYHPEIPMLERMDVAPAGAVVCSGFAKGVVCATGSSCYISSVDKLNKDGCIENVSIISKLASLSKKINLLLYSSVFFLVILYIIFGPDNAGLFEAFIIGCSLSAIAFGEFIVLYGYLNTAICINSIYRNVKNTNSGALIKNPEKIDALSDITTVIVPIEQFLSQTSCEIDTLYVNGELMTAGKNGFRSSADNLLRLSAVSTGIYGSRVLQKNISGGVLYTAEENSIISAVKKAKLYNISLEKDYPIIDHVGYSRMNRFETTLTLYRGSFMMVFRGDIRGIVSCCNYRNEYGKIIALDNDFRNGLFMIATMLTKKAYRVLAVATKFVSEANLARLYSNQCDMTFEGLICIKEPLLEGAEDNIALCHNAGIKVIALCDNISESNRYIAGALGIVKNNDEIITKRRIEQIDSGIRDEMIVSKRLFEGVDTECKKAIVSAFSAKGERVAVLNNSIYDTELLPLQTVSFSQSSSRTDDNVKVIDLKKYVDRSLPAFAKTPSDTFKTGCEVIRTNSDVIVGQVSKKSGGFNAIVGAMSGASASKRNFCVIARYLVLAFFSLAVLNIASLFGDVSYITIAQTVYIGFFVDAFLIYSIASDINSKSAIGYNDDIPCDIKNFLRYMFPYFLSGTLIGMLLIFIPYISKLFEIYDVSRCLTSITFVSVISILTVVAAEMKNINSIFRRHNVNISRLIIMLVPLLVTIAVCTNSNLITSFGGNILHSSHWLVVMILSVLALAICEIIRYVYPHIIKKENLSDRHSAADVVRNVLSVDGLEQDERYSSEELEKIMTVSEEDYAAEVADENTIPPSEEVVENIKELGHEEKEEKQ